MSLLKDIFGRKKKKLTCGICGKEINNNFKTKYLKINGCLELATVHYECDKKLKEMEAKLHE